MTLSQEILLSRGVKMSYLLSSLYLEKSDSIPHILYSLVIQVGLQYPQIWNQQISETVDSESMREGPTEGPTLWRQLKLGFGCHWKVFCSPQKPCLTVCGPLRASVCSFWAKRKKLLWSFFTYSGLRMLYKGTKIHKMPDKGKKKWLKNQK